MKKPGSNLVWEVVGVIATLAAIYGGLCLWCYFEQRPLFCNRFGFSEKLGGIPTWSPRYSEVEDAAGNRFLADFRLNVLVVLQLPTEYPPILAPAEASTVKVRLPVDETISVDIKRNTIIQVHPDRTVSSRILKPDGAEELFGEIERSDLPDRNNLVNAN